MAALGESGGSDRATALASGHSYQDAFLGDISSGEKSLGDALRLELFVVYKNCWDIWYAGEHSFGYEQAFISMNCMHQLWSWEHVSM